jgi:cyclopropane fatty-acyl-phospholipid synthase-like methyltransferase
VGAAWAACGPEPRGAEHGADLDIAEVLHLPTPHPVVDAMLELARVAPGDVVYDLGSGDGRIPIAAARRYGVRAVGIELDRALVEQARCRASEAGVAHLVEFRQQDIFHTDLREASIVTLFLFPQTNQALLPKLRAELRPGARVVSHRFGIGDWRPAREVEAHGHPLLLWLQ